MNEHTSMFIAAFAASFSGNVVGRVLYHVVVAAWQRRQARRAIDMLVDCSPTEHKEETRELPR